MAESRLWTGRLTIRLFLKVKQTRSYRRFRVRFQSSLCVSLGFFAFDIAVIGHNPRIPIVTRIVEFIKAYRGLTRTHE